MKLKALLLAFTALVGAPFISAQVVVLHDFSSFESPNTFFLGDWELNGDPAGSNSPLASFSQGAGVYNFVGGSNSDTAAAFHFYLTPLDISGNTNLDISARLLPGNAAATFTVSLFDSLGESAFAVFSTAAFAGLNFITISEVLTFSPGFNPSDLAFFQISGGVSGGANPLNLALNNLAVTPVPEPATYGAFAGLALVALVVLKRRCSRA
jgi:hypothetical protein